MNQSSASRLHGVQFYETDAFLCEAVGRFLDEGLARGAPVVVFATPTHRAAFVEFLSGKGWNCDVARRDGSLTLLDAAETLEMFMAAGMPNERLFRSYMGSLLGQLTAMSRLPIHAYGEMVNILWEAGQKRAALQLEELWNELSQRYHFELLCAYALPNFVNAGDSALIDVCSHHNHVGRVEARTNGSEAPSLELHLLQHRIRELEQELATLKPSPA